MQAQQHTDPYQPDTRFMEHDEREVERSIRRAQRREARAIAAMERGEAEQQSKEGWPGGPAENFLERLPPEKNNGVVPGLSPWPEEASA